MLATCRSWCSAHQQPDTVEPTQTMFRDALAALGQVDGRNVRIDVRLAEGHPEWLPELTEALVREKASVILAFGPPAIRAVRRATSTIPIVATGGDLVGDRLIKQLGQARRQHHRGQPSHHRTRCQATRDPQGDYAGGAALWAAARPGWRHRGA